LIRDPRLLGIRGREISFALDALAPEEGEDAHVALMGEAHSGRSSVLAEVSRRLGAERGRLVVELARPDALDPERRAFLRHLMIALVETLAAAIGESAPWYAAWRERVYLRSTASIGAGDLLSSALFLAAEPDGEIDQAVLERDLAVLLDIAREAGFKGIVVTVDDASPLTEDVDLIEELVDCFDLLGGYSLLIAGLPTTARHFTEASSSCLQRFRPVWLARLRGHRILTALRAPLSTDDRVLLKDEYDDLLRDLTQLTGGNVYELMVVAHHLWMSCKLGEQEQFVLTPRVLDRIIPHIALLTAEGDALRDGAEAIDLLPEERVREAVVLASYSRLSVREIAIIRLLGLEREEIDLERPVETEDIAAESERVRAVLGELEEAGVVSVDPGGERFGVVGDRATTVLLKYKARARLGDSMPGAGFDFGFLPSVGQCLAGVAGARWLGALSGGRRLGVSVATAKGGIGRHSPRPGIRALAGEEGIGRLIEAELDFVPWSEAEKERIAALLSEDDPVIALVCTSVMYGGDQLEHMEAWELSEEADQSALDNAGAQATDESWVSIVESADLGWSGSEGVLLRGAAAREALIALFQIGATVAVHENFRKWVGGGDPGHLDRARRVAAEAVATLRKTGHSDVMLGGELAGMLSRLGFLESFDDGLLGEACASLEEAVRIGAGDGWVTRWNYVNVLARSGEADAALAQLDLLEEEYEGDGDEGYVFFFLPGRPTSDSFVKVEGPGIGALLNLQRAILDAKGGVALQVAIEACLASGDEGAATVAGWAEPPALAA
jgi:hypothetical protein